jgi:hypothetical protein
VFTDATSTPSFNNKVRINQNYCIVGQSMSYALSSWTRGPFDVRPNLDPGTWGSSWDGDGPRARSTLGACQFTGSGDGCRPLPTVDENGQLALIVLDCHALPVSVGFFLVETPLLLCQRDVPNATECLPVDVLFGSARPGLI